MASSYLLVVDDDPAVSTLLRLILQRGGWKARVAYDAAQALEMARAEPPAVLLVDMWMPGMNGAGLVRELRAEPRLATVPVIMTTGDVDAPELPDCFAVVSKPFRIPVLYRTIRAALRNGQEDG